MRHKVSFSISGSVPDAERIRTDAVQIGAELGYGEWIRLAQTNLHGSSRAYIDGLQALSFIGKTALATITLAGWLPNSIENGLAPFDMKPGLLSGPNSRATKDRGGRYNTVPFRHGTPGVTGRNFAAMPKNVYSKVKGLTGARTTPGKGTVKTGGRGPSFGDLGKRSMLPVKGGRPGAYTWKSSPYAGMVRSTKKYQTATQSQYTTFRRVSSKSDPNSWWHPGFRAVRLAPQVVKYVEREIGAYIRRRIEGTL
jgi:hypothetical protein